MTFKKNLLVMGLVALCLCVGAYLTHMAQDEFIAGATMWIASVILTLAFEDMFRKKNAAGGLTWQYFVGTGLVILSVVAFLWASESVVLMVNIYRLMIAVFFGFVGGLWFHVPYKNSVMDAEEQYARRWEGVVKKIGKAKKEEAKIALINKNLRYHTADNSLAGVLDFDNPLVPFNDKFLTVSEIEPLVTEDAESPAKRLYDRASAYTKSLVKEVQ